MAKTSKTKKTTKKSTTKKVVRAKKQKVSSNEVNTVKEPTPEKINVEEIISELIGDDVLEVVKKIKNKEAVSENDLVAPGSKDINQARNALYKLYENNLVSFTRKKDKTNGLYIYYWTFNEDKIQTIVDTSNREKLEMLRNRLGREKNNQFFRCTNNCIRLDFDQALDFEFRCPECGELLEFDDNSHKIKDIETQIKDIEDYFEKREKEKESQAKEIMKKMKEEEEKELELSKQEKEKEEKQKEEQINKIKVTKDIMLVEIFDKKLLELFSKLYKPFTLSKHKTDQYQYIIYEKKNVIGIVSYKQKSSSIMQILLWPTKQKKGIAQKIIKSLEEELKFKTLDWHSHKFNIPQLKLLKKLGGGLTTNNPKNINQKGTIKFGKTGVAKKYVKYLEDAIEANTSDYKKWVKELNSRKKEKEELKQYLKELKLK